MIKRLTIGCALVVLGSLGTNAYSQDYALTGSPEAIVRGAAEAALQRLDGRREYLEANPAELRAIVDEVFRPRFDTAYAAFLVLGRHGRSASGEQKRRFTTALYNYILTRYAHGLLRFEADRLEILPYHGNPDADKATIRTFVRLDDGTNVPVNYNLRHGDAGWRVYDITIEGVSYVLNLRNQLGAEIEQIGLDEVILRLEANRAPGENDAA